MRRLLIFLLLCLSPLALLAAEKPQPKIGLVLSGGAARGLAHVGVLKALEEQGCMPRATRLMSWKSSL